MSEATESMKEAARQIRNVAAEIHGVADYEIGETRERVPEAFVGDAAKALTDRLEEMNYRLKWISNRLDDTAWEILQYAWWLE